MFSVFNQIQFILGFKHLNTRQLSKKKTFSVLNRLHADFYGKRQ